jgi:hypothetical protein
VEKRNQWEYRVQSFGNLFKDANDKDLQTELNAWGLEGWEVTTAYHTSGNKVTLIARRTLDASTRRQRSWELADQA